MIQITHSFIRSFFAKIVAVLGIVFLLSPGSEAQIFWDPSAAGNGITGGSTTGEATEWKTSGSNIWWNGTSDIAWTNGNNATFGGTAGTVNLGSAISAGTLNFATAGYTIDLKDFTGTSGNSLTVTGLSGSTGSILSTATTGVSGNTLFTLNNSTTQTWNGTINMVNGSSERFNFVKTGAGTFNFSGSLTGNGDNSLQIQQGTFRLNGATASNETMGVVLTGGALDLNGNNFLIRKLDSSVGTQVTSATAATLTIQRSNITQTINGTLEGAGLALNNTRNNTLNLNGANSYGGGTSLSLANNSGTMTVNVNTNSGLGTGALTTTLGTGTSRIDVNFTSAAPVIGSLTGSASGGGTHLNLGTTGVNTNLTINQTTNTTYAGTINQFTGRTGSLTKQGNGTLLLTGINTYTGNTTVSAGALSMGSTSELRFLITNLASNKVDGIGAAIFDGTFRLDISGLTASSGTWNLVDVTTLNETFNSNFGLRFLDNTTFTNAGGGLYTSGNWNFSTTTGNLALIPEPSTWALLILGLGGVIVLRRQNRKG